jgi:hypothetical protein
MALEGRTDNETAVREIMSSPLIVVTPQTTIDECMALMTDRRVRHLPVVDGGVRRRRPALARVCRALQDPQSGVKAAEVDAPRPRPIRLLDKGFGRRPMERLWSLAGATGGNRWQMAYAQKPPKRAKIHPRLLACKARTPFIDTRDHAKHLCPSRTATFAPRHATPTHTRACRSVFGSGCTYAECKRCASPR